MPTFFVRTINGNTISQGEWQEVEADTAEEAAQKVCEFPVVEAIKRLSICAEVRAGSKAGMGRFYRSSSPGRARSAPGAPARFAAKGR
jgi:hypothetical protein